MSAEQQDSKPIPVVLVFVLTFFFLRQLARVAYYSRWEQGVTYDIGQVAAFSWPSILLLAGNVVSVLANLLIAGTSVFMLMSSRMSLLISLSYVGLSILATSEIVCKCLNGFVRPSFNFDLIALAISALSLAMCLTSALFVSRSKSD